MNTDNNNFFKKTDIREHAYTECQCFDYTANGWCIGCGKLYESIIQMNISDKSIALVNLKAGEMFLAVNPSSMFNIGKLLGLAEPKNKSALRSYMVRLALSAQTAMFLIVGRRIIVTAEGITATEVWQSASKVITTNILMSNYSIITYPQLSNENISAFIEVIDEYDSKNNKSIDLKPFSEANVKVSEVNNRTTYMGMSKYANPNTSINILTAASMQLTMINGVNSQKLNDDALVTTVAGVGVRVGIYTSSIAFLLEAMTRPEEAPGSVAAGILLVGSAFIMGLIDTVSKDIDAPSLYVLLYLTGTVTITYGYIWNAHFLAARTLVYTAIIIAVCIQIFMIWFCFGGQEMTDWDTFVGFFFSRQLFSGWLHIFVGIVTAVALFLTLYITPYIIRCSWRANIAMHDIRNHIHATTYCKMITRTARVLFQLLFSVIGTIVGTELIIQWNELSYLNKWDSGQIIAAMVGVYPLSRALIAIIKSLISNKWNINRREMDDALIYMQCLLTGTYSEFLLMQQDNEIQLEDILNSPNDENDEVMITSNQSRSSTNIIGNTIHRRIVGIRSMDEPRNNESIIDIHTKKSQTY